MTKRISTLFLILAAGGGSLWSQERGHVLKRGEGELLLGGSRIVKASPRTGTRGAEMIWDAMPVGRSTGIHVHLEADEFFYVISGNGSALVGDKEQAIEAGDIAFVPRGEEHRLRNAGNTGPLEIVFLVDRPGLATQFREDAARSEALGRRLTLEEKNRISQKFGRRTRPSSSAKRPNTRLQPTPLGGSAKRRG